MIASAERMPGDTDRDLERRVADYLAERSMPALRRVEIAACEGEVTLRGRVASFYEKQVLLNCHKAVPGVRGIVDLVDVA